MSDEQLQAAVAAPDPVEVKSKLQHLAKRGDQIDLWNGSRLTDSQSWIRIRMGLTIPGVWPDLEDSRQIGFWQVS